MSVTDKAVILKRVPIFSSLSDDELNALAKLAIERDFMSNESISVSYTHLTLPTNREV